MQKLIDKISVKSLNGLVIIGLVSTIGLNSYKHQNSNLVWLIPMAIFMLTIVGLLMYKKWQAGERKLVKQELWWFGSFGVLLIGLLIYFLN